jgi:hypothetical protein
MNWQMTRPGKVRFEKGEPFCFFTLVEDKKLEEIQPSLRMLDSNPALKKDYEAWASSRTDFNERLEKREPQAQKQRWQRHYMAGKNVATGEEVDSHVTKRKLKAPLAPKPPLPGLGG